MTAPNHIAGGLTFSGIFASFWNINILSDWKLIAFTTFVCLLPDIDHTKSIIGKFFYPVAKWIQRRYGHRTITHNMNALLLLTLICSLVLNSEYTFLFFFAYLSHIIIDMTTVQGVPFMYPFNNNPHVIPGKVELRFRTGDLKTETMCFTFFLLMGVFCYPLINNGFWLQYNKAFSTMKHLSNQYGKTDKLMNVDYLYREGSNRTKGTGYCLEASESKAVLLNGRTFVTLDESKIVERVEPTITEKELTFNSIRFFNIDMDSLNSMIRNGLYKSIQVNSNKSINVFENGFKSQATTFTGEYPNDLYFGEIPEAVKTVEPFQSNPRIRTLSIEISQLESENRILKSDWQRHLDDLEVTKRSIDGEQDLTKKDRLIRKLRDLEKVKKPKFLTDRIQGLKLTRNELITLDNQKLQLHQSKVTKPVELSLSGELVSIVIN